MPTPYRILQFFKLYKQFIRLLVKPRIGFSGQEGICEKPEFTAVNEDFEQIIDEPRGLKATALQEVYFKNRLFLFIYLRCNPTQHFIY
ncbi:MAG: hypothetical protein BGO68_06100 [Candidatus Amoebophilus sp. 36-38]|nr:MAG: hypothetical protein BGO68_06100 [Candidatus Amoebophilus sp. 36-38]